MKLHSIVSISTPQYPVLRLTFDDGVAGDVDFSDTIARGGVMAMLSDPDVFAAVRLGDGGRSLGWLDAAGNDVDFCADALRFRVEEGIVRDRAAAYAAARSAAE